MDHQVDLLEFEPDDLQQIPSRIGSDGQPFWWIGIWLQIQDRDGAVEGVANGCVVDPVLVSGTMNLHISQLL